MEYSEIMVRYGELSTKGKNRRIFINQLAKNVRHSLHDFPEVKIHADRDRMHLILNGVEYKDIKARLLPIFGIQNFSPALQIEKDLSSLKKAVQEQMREIYQEGQTFKINTRRSDHKYAYDTNQLNQILGDAVLECLPTIKVQMKNPDIKVLVEIRQESAYISCETINGAGGLPVGSSGKGMLMLSGGIDSPVAGYLSMKRGVEIEAVHFASPPYTSEKALLKAMDLTVKLTPYVGKIQFIEVPFTEIQEEIKQKVPSGYLMTVTRRMMMRITDILRKQRRGLAIINGESLGQVASQTLPSMVAINDVTVTPVIRPVVSMDKLEIIDIANAIDTFNLSIQPYEDCCTIFAPPQPKTKPKLEKVREYEKYLQVDELIVRAVAGIKITEIKTGQSYLNSAVAEFEDFL